jgi:NAD-dependent deacetylase
MDYINETKNLIEKAKNILVVSGAGISTAAGIPDFRSSGGLYEMVSKKYNLQDPTIVFDIDYFMKDPSLFYKLSPNLQKDYEPTIAHKYIAQLEKDHEVTILTQNIDGLHQKAGSTNVIAAHGSMTRVRCLSCGHIEEEPVYTGDVLTCELCGGLMKPDVVFFGEGLPQQFHHFYENWRNYKFDLLFIVGTGLQVYPVAGLVQNISQFIKDTIYITKEGNPMVNSTVRVTEDIEKFFKKLSNNGDGWLNKLTNLFQLS